MKFRTVVHAALLLGLLTSSAFAAKAETRFVPVGSAKVAMTTARGGKTTLHSLRGPAVTFKGKVLGLTNEGQLLVKLGKHSGGGHVAINPRTGTMSKMPQGADSTILQLVQRPIK